MLGSWAPMARGRNPRFFWVLGGTLLVLAACDINPQPLPPAQVAAQPPVEDAATNVPGDTGSGKDGGSEHADGGEPDAAQSLESGVDGAEDAPFGEDGEDGEDGSEHDGEVE
jgi:hypothetical protein